MARYQRILLALSIILCLFAVADEFRITGSAQVIASKEPYDYATDADLLTVKISTNQNSQAQVKDDRGRVLGTDASWTQNHEIMIGKLSTGTYKLKIEAYNLTGSQDYAYVSVNVAKARANLRTVPIEYAKDIEIPCRSSGAVKITDSLSLTNQGKLDAYNVMAELDSSYMCNEDGDCPLEVTLGDRYQNQLSFSEVQSGQVQYITINMKTVQVLTPWTTYSTPLRIEGSNALEIVVDLNIRFVPALDVRVSPDTFSFENACGNEKRTITIEDRCCVFDLPLAVDVNMDDHPFIFTSKSYTVPKCGKATVDFTLGNLTLLEGEDEKQDDYKINLHFGDELLQVPADVLVRPPELRLSPRSIGLDAPCKGELKQPIELYVPSTSGCIRDLELNITGNIKDFTFEFEAEKTNNLSPGDRISGTMNIEVPEYIKAGEYAGRLAATYPRTKTETAKKEMVMFLRVPRFDYLLKAEKVDMRELPCGDFRSQNITIIEVDGGCADGITGEIVDCDFNNTFITVAKGTIGVSAKETGDFDLEVNVPHYLPPDTYKCGLRITIPDRGDRTVPFSFTIPHPQLMIEMSDKLTLYKERPPSITGNTSLILAEVGGFTPLRNITFGVVARSCPVGIEEACERYAKAVETPRPVFEIDKGGRLTVPVGLGFDFSDPRGDYTMGLIIDALNDDRAAEERSMEFEIIPPSCRKARDDIKLIDRRFPEVKKALRDFLVHCDDWSKRDPVMSAKAAALVSSFSVFSTNVLTLNEMTRSHNLTSVRALSILRSTERNLEVLCIDIEEARPICDMANATLLSTLEEVGRYYCMNSTTRSERLRHNGAMANVFLSQVNLRCTIIDNLDVVSTRYENVQGLRQEALGDRILPPRALEKYARVIKEYRDIEKGYADLGLTDDVGKVKNERIIIESEREDLALLWSTLINVVVAFAFMVTVIITGMYVRYRIKTQKVLEL